MYKRAYVRYVFGEFRLDGGGLYFIFRTIKSLAGRGFLVVYTAVVDDDSSAASPAISGPDVHVSPLDLLRAPARPCVSRREKQKTPFRFVFSPKTS